MAGTPQLQRPWAWSHPESWRGICRAGTAFNASNCNKKIIGARYFLKGYEGEFGRLNDTVDGFGSARDVDGHGSHCVSIAAGNYVTRANSSQLAVGMAPKTRMAVCKAGWTSLDARFLVSDIPAAFDKAVLDGVDVISIFISGSGVQDVFEDLQATAAFSAVKEGTFVSTATGNGGLMAGSVINVAPWFTTVFAATQDRAIEANVVLGNGITLKGRSKFDGRANMTSDILLPIIIYGGAALNKRFARNGSFCQ